MGFPVRRKGSAPRISSDGKVASYRVSNDPRHKTIGGSPMGSITSSLTRRARPCSGKVVSLSACALALSICTLIALSAPLVTTGQENASSENVNAALERILSESSESLPGGTFGVALRDTLRDFYRARGWEPLFTGSDEGRERARAALEVLAAASADGLDPGDYDADIFPARLRNVAGQPDDVIAQFDIDLSYAVLRYADDLAVGRIDPRSLPIPWDFPPRRVPLTDVLQAIAGGQAPSEALAQLAPAHKRYHALRSSRKLYSDLAAGGWPPVPPGPTLKVGDRAPRYRLDALRHRLEADNSLAPTLLASAQDHDGNRTADFSSYDDQLASAVRAFQYKYGLDPDGVIGPRTIKALNVSPAERLQAIDINMEYWRWLPEHLPADRIEVDVPAFELAVFGGDSLVRNMRVVVGREGWATPAFSATMQYMVLNPYWYVPNSIAIDEVVPKAREDPGYLAAHHFRVFRSWSDAAANEASVGAAVDPLTIDWSAAAPNHFPWIIRQDPGSENPLGDIKFMFPNRYSIYLHGTPSRGLFNRYARAFSHGCIRIQDPHWLAAYLFRGDPSWSRDRLENEIATHATRQIPLTRKIPVYVLHFSVFPDSAGTICFRDDLYGVRQETELALAKRSRDLSAAR